jgi:hypothetical protein
MCFNPISFFYKISILSIIVDRKSNDALIEPFFHPVKEDNTHGLCTSNNQTA